MKNKVYWVICICPLWLFLSNCVDKFNAHLPESSIGLLIVEGSIISDSAVVFSLSRSFSLDVEGVPPDFNKVDAEVCVTGEDGSSFRGVALGNGKYRVAVGTLHRDVRYSLKIVYEGDIYTSEPQYPIGTTPPGRAARRRSRTGTPARRAAASCGRTCRTTPSGGAAAQPCRSPVLHQDQPLRPFGHDPRFLPYLFHSQSFRRVLLCRALVRKL